MSPKERTVQIQTFFKIPQIVASIVGFKLFGRINFVCSARKKKERKKETKNVMSFLKRESTFY